jgi:hypothetical protein
VMRNGVEAPAPPNAPTLATMTPARTIQLDGDATEPLRPQITREPIPMPRVTNVFGNRPGEVSAATIDAATGIIALSPLTIVPLSSRPIVIAPLVLRPLSKSGQ